MSDTHGRRNGVHGAGTVSNRTYDDLALAQVHRLVDPAPRYGLGTSGPPTVTLDVAADWPDPNVAAPAVGEYLSGANRDTVAFAAFPAAGQSLDVEVWGKSDLELVPGTPLWLRMDVVAGAALSAEYLVRTRCRDVYLRPVNVVLAAAPNIALCACLV